MQNDIVLKISKRKLKDLFTNAAKSAAAINLLYVSDSQPGISRTKHGKHFIYRLGTTVLKDEEQLFRINQLVIPPAWRNVWICPYPNGHLQVTGIDTKNRKQYKYHPLWNALRNHTKFYHLHAFGKALPAMRRRLQQDLSLSGLPQHKVLAAVISLMQCTCIRVGSSIYERLYGSFGITTLKDRHVTIDGNLVRFSFKGKKGVYHDITIKNKKLARIVRQCRDIPGKELFQYYDSSGQRHPIDSGMVNDYIKEISEGDFTAKDFRTWAGTLHALEAFKQMEATETLTAIKKNIVAALDIVAKQLGNTRTVCKKYYVHPLIIEHYMNGTLYQYLETNDTICDTDIPELSVEEKIMMKILEDAGTAILS